MTYEAVKARKLELLKQRKALYEGGEVPDDCCPGCGWHVSSHGLSSYGLDCPGGTSPSALAGKLARRVRPKPTESGERS